MNRALSLAPAILVLATMPALADADGRYGGHMWGDGMMAGGGFLMMLLMAAVIVAVIVLVWRVVGGPTVGRRDEAMTSLRDRFARGEIDEAEFRARKAALSD